MEYDVVIAKMKKEFLEVVQTVYQKISFVDAVDKRNKLSSSKKKETRRNYFIIVKSKDNV
jgi:hypothetical protein